MSSPDVIPVESQDLLVPSLDELAQVLKDGLSKNFAEVDVQVVECPDLKQKPWTLAASGICGNPRIADVGGVPYLLPLPNLKRVYSFEDVAEKAGMPGGFVIGAGAASSKFVGVNAEMMANVVAASKENPGQNATKCARVNEQDGSCILENYSCGEFSLLGNFLVSQGQQGKVLKVCAGKRTGDKTFITSMRVALACHYGDKAVGIGGAFLLEKGKAKTHVMPRFSKEPLENDEAVNKWLKFYEMTAPLVAVGVFESIDPGLDLRVEHFHCFSDHGQGGHYHCDVTPDEVHYVGYFTPAERLCRVDRPIKTHQFGRD